MWAAITSVVNRLVYKQTLTADARSSQVEQPQPEAWKQVRAVLPCDVCMLHTPEHPSNAWRLNNKKKYGYQQLCWSCERSLERWQFWDEESLVAAMPTHRAVWIAFRHTNRLRKAKNTRLRAKGNSRTKKASNYVPMLSEKRIAQLVVLHAKC